MSCGADLWLGAGAEGFSGSSAQIHYSCFSVHQIMPQQGFLPPFSPIFAPLKKKKPTILFLSL